VFTTFVQKSTPRKKLADSSSLFSFLAALNLQKKPPAIKAFICGSQLAIKMPQPLKMWYYCLAGKGTMDITHEWCPKITSGEATSDFGTTSV
jgi:hypothetical protein